MIIGKNDFCKSNLQKVFSQHQNESWNMKIIDIIEHFIPGDWGEENLTDETPCKVSCIRGADIVPIENNDFGHIPTRYISKQSFETKCLQAGFSSPWDCSRSQS